MNQNNLVTESTLSSISSEKKTMIFYPHFALGDILNLSGAIRYFAKTYKVTLVIVKSTMDNVKTFFDDITDISYHTIDIAVYYNDNKEFYDYINSKYNEVKFVGLHLTKNEKLTDPLPNAPFSFYEDLELPFSIYKNSYVDKSYKNQNEYKLHGLDFVFISTDSPNHVHQLKLNNDMLIICPDKNLYDLKHPNYYVANTFVNLPFLQYKTIMEFAAKLYLIDYDFFNLATKCDSFNTKELICYCRNGNKYDKLDKRFKYEPTKTSFNIGVGEDGMVNGVNRALLLNRLAKRR
jgi:hypothetical protein